MGFGVGETPRPGGGVYHPRRLQSNVGQSVARYFTDNIRVGMVGVNKVEKGDSIFVTETPEGLAITAHDPAFEEQMKAAQAIMKKRRNVLRELAK